LSESVVVFGSSALMRSLAWSCDGPELIRI